MRRVLKIGGSLLTQPRLGYALRRWLQRLPPAQSLAIVGGGQLIDAMRKLDETAPCDPAWIHWQCVHLLSTTTEFVARQICDWKHLSDPALAQRLIRSRPIDQQTYLLNVDTFYAPRPSDRFPKSPIAEAPLPENWDTTTDAIAAWLAELASADELILLKSCDVDETQSLQQLAQVGVVDAAIGLIPGRSVPIRFVNFSAECQR